VAGGLFVVLGQFANRLARTVAVRLGNRKPGIGQRPRLVRHHVFQPVEDLQHGLGVLAVHPDIVAGEIVGGLGIQVGRHVLGLVTERVVPLRALARILGLDVLQVHYLGPVVVRGYCLIAPIASSEHRFLDSSAAGACQVRAGMVAQPWL